MLHLESNEEQFPRPHTISLVLNFYLPHLSTIGLIFLMLNKRGNRHNDWGA